MPRARDTKTFDAGLERDEPSAHTSCRSLLAGAVALGSLAATAARTTAQETGDAGAGRLTTEAHTTTLSDGTAYAWERGTLLVPQNRANPDGPVFELAFHRFPALPGADPATPAVFVLNGGPGFPGLRNEPERAEWIEGNMMTRIADRVIVGQRGIGTSGPNTACAGPRAPRAGEPFDVEAMMGAAVEAARACRVKWEAEGVDLSGITVIEAADDVRDLARALGYDRIQIQGVSFGSHWGMAVLRYHPEIVARALLAGMEGPDHTYDMPGWILDDLERIAADAEGSGSFAGRVPDGGILAGFRRTISGITGSSSCTGARTGRSARLPGPTRPSARRSVVSWRPETCPRSPTRSRCRRSTGSRHPPGPASRNTERTGSIHEPDAGTFYV